jgi:hypothetical protein
MGFSVVFVVNDIGIWSIRSCGREGIARCCAREGSALLETIEMNLTTTLSQLTTEGESIAMLNRSQAWPDSPTFDTLEPRSNLTLSRTTITFSQYTDCTKQSFLVVSSDTGMKIDGRNEDGRRMVVQRPNHRETVSSDTGRQIDQSDVQQVDADWPRREDFGRVSNSKATMALGSLRQDSEIVSTHDKRQMY